MSDSEYNYLDYIDEDSYDSGDESEQSKPIEAEETIEAVKTDNIESEPIQPTKSLNKDVRKHKKEPESESDEEEEPHNDHQPIPKCWERNKQFINRVIEWLDKKQDKIDKMNRKPEKYSTALIRDINEMIRLTDRIIEDVDKIKCGEITYREVVRPSAVIASLKRVSAIHINS